VTCLALTCLRLDSITEGGASSLLPSRYLDPDPLLLATAHGGDRRPQNGIQNPRFHALNQAIVQLVSRSFHRSLNPPRDLWSKPYPP
jgi:hypothetical protein